MKKILSFWLLFLLLLNNMQVLAADGLRTIYIFVKDQAWNIQMVPATSQITLDTTPPVITMSVNPNNSQTQTKTVRATITDTNLDTIKYIQIPSGTTCNGLLTFNNDYTSGDNIVLSSENDNGTKICFRAKDKANNYTYLSSNTIENIDKTAPTVTVIYKNASDEVIWATDPTTTRKIWATIFDPTTWSSNFWNPTLSISTTLSPGTYSSNEQCSAATFSTYTTERVFSNPVADNWKQVCFRWVDPAGNTSYVLVTVVMNAIPTFTSISKNDSYINSENEWAVSFTVVWIFDNDNDDVTIKYSWNGTTFSDLVNITWTNVIKNHGPFTLDTTSRPQWSNTLYVKLNDGNYDSEIKNVSIFKDSILPIITVNNIPNSNPAQVKYMSGVITDTNSFSGYIKIVDSSEICSEQTYTTSYTSGQNITLDNESYNGKKVCFKAVDQYDNISYSSSSVITWIDKTPPVTPTSVNINWGDLFTNNKIINLDITHPNESDVYEWCVTEDNDYNSCIWVQTKPTTYELRE